ncbi:MAG TPA: adenylate/guanylate cyclase domain-containing protein [Acidimicrobiia bacterium]|nr:adenylate/guanylate cyclase domain-containing protein [Acidimicrobiia bacterium]
MNLPTGVVTFVFSDIEGSTRLWEEDPTGMAQSLARHDEIVGSVIDAAGGTVFKHTGDGFGAAFESVTAGVEAAAQITASFASEPWRGPPLRSRIGVHSGEAEPRDGDYFGATVTRTARLMDAGNGGQILISEASRQLLGGRVPDGMSLTDEGEHRLKDLGEPLRIYRLLSSGGDDPRQLRTLERAPHNLPIQLSTFVGRQTDIKEVADLVRQSRLVTLTGIGGVGKTRLSLQVAAEVLADFADGAWFVELAPLAEPGLLADTVANSMRVPPDSSLSAEETLMRFLAPRQALLVIDNCEHLIDDVASFADTLLRRCPDVHVLATSREGLSVTGESLWRVPSLRVDDDAAAVELFAERARLVQPGFTVNEHNRTTVAELCVRLDGIPLAIELATARLKMLSVEQIAEHLGDRFRLLTGGSRVAVERQRTLRAMMDWSHDLLSPREQVLLRRLSVFSDGFDYEAAERVCSGDGIDTFDILDVLGHLVEASMVAFESDPRPRYRLLETVRQYALDKLFESGESDDIRLTHAEHFRAVSQLINDSLEHNDYTVSDIATEELGNLRAAMTWTIESGRGELALQIACNLRMYFWGRVMYRESIRWITTALALVDDDTSPLVATGAAFAMIDATNIEDSATIESLRGRVEALLDSGLPDSERGELANALAAVTMAESVTRADQLFKQAHDLLRAAGNPRWGAPVQNRMLSAWFMNSREHEAEVLRLTEEATAEGINVRATVVRTAFLVIAGEYETVIRTVASHSPDADWERGMMLLFRAHSERALGLFSQAATSVAAAMQVFGSDVLGAQHWETAMLHLQGGDIDAAIATYEMIDQDARYLSAFSRLEAVLFWSLVAQRRGEFESAAILAGFADALAAAAGLARLDADVQIIEESRRVVRASLGQALFEDHYRRGSKMEWDELPITRSGARSDPPTQR